MLVLEQAVFLIYLWTGLFPRSYTVMFYFVTVYPACKHEALALGSLKDSHKVEKVLTQVTDYLQRCADYIFQLCRMILRWLPISVHFGFRWVFSFLWFSFALAPKVEYFALCISHGRWNFVWEPSYVWIVEFLVAQKLVEWSCESHAYYPALWVFWLLDDV